MASPVSRAGLFKVWVATPFGVAKLNFGVANHRAKMTFMSKWVRQLKKFKKRCSRESTEQNTYCLAQ